VIDVRVLQRIAPLVPFGDGQRQRGVQDGGQRIDERHLGQHPGEHVRGQVQHRADQQTAGAAAEGHQVGRPGQPGTHQMLGDRDEIGETVRLVQQLAVLVPEPAQFPAAADMRDGEHHATVQQ
jgi:hypothetical protein